MRETIGSGKGKQRVSKPTDSAPAKVVFINERSANPSPAFRSGKTLALRTHQSRRLLFPLPLPPDSTVTC